MASNQRQRKAAGLKRLSLLGFGSLLVLLFVGIAVASGIGDPTIRSGEVAVVEDVPDGVDGTITEEEFRRGIVQAAAENEIKPVPKPGDEQYEGLKQTALSELLNSIWVEGAAAEMGITATPKEVEAELKKIQEESFGSVKQFEEFAKESGYTTEDVDRRVTLQVLSTKIQAQIQEEAPTPSESEVKDYYEVAKATQYTTPESRDIRLIVNKDKAKVEEAKQLLEEDSSVKNWEKVAKKYSTDPATKNKGGLQTNLSEGSVSEPLDKAVFAPEEQGELEGPLEETRGYVIFEVAKITKESVQSFEEVKPQITTQLSEELAQRSFTRFVNDFTSTWRSRTFCAEAFTTESCANFSSDGRPAEVNPACYEADPAEPAEACPALVTQVKPAQPGSVNLLTPEGQQLAQRPVPAEGAEAAALEGAELPPGVAPEGVPEGEAAPEGN